MYQLIINVGYIYNINLVCTTYYLLLITILNHVDVIHVIFTKYIIIYTLIYTACVYNMYCDLFDGVTQYLVHINSLFPYKDYINEILIGSNYPIASIMA